MFDKILIANRGEITCRVIATAQRLGIKTVAVYSDADAAAKHVRMADEACCIGLAPSTESYLRGEAIIDVAKRAGAQAIHPGYGFLSENPEFVSQVETAGLKFVGPSAEAITKMGLKDGAKELIEHAGVPVVPGYHGENQDLEFLQSQADKIGYPVLIKARAGGGGKGMRLVEQAADFADAFAAAAREGQASFGDPVCLIEKYITNPRHIEVQVFGDAHGNVVHMFERDCSLQRRHQKVIEEAPAPGITEDVRKEICDAAVKAAKAINYEGAGTIEFIADGSKGLRKDGFWFMEMNTRLQVEHPVSEAITGIDFVELQLKIAAGEPIGLAQGDIPLNGHAVEARIYAEDPMNEFLPSIGKIDRFDIPAATKFARGAVRLDSAVDQTDTISSFYDPMIAKLITHNSNRASALAAMSQAIGETNIHGVTTNLDFLGALIAHPDFAGGQFDTGLIARNLQTLLMPSPASDLVCAVAAVASLGLIEKPHGISHWVDTIWPSYLFCDGAEIRAEVLQRQAGKFEVDGLDFEIQPQGQNRICLMHADAQVTMSVFCAWNRVTVVQENRKYHFDIPDPLDRDQAEERPEQLCAPMPGLVQSLLVTAGDRIAKDQVLMVMEAMKMEHSLKAPAAGSVAKLHVIQGQQVDAAALVIELEFDDA